MENMQIYGKNQFNNFVRTDNGNKIPNTIKSCKIGLGAFYVQTSDEQFNLFGVYSVLFIFNVPHEGERELYCCDISLSFIEKVWCPLKTAV